MYTCGQLTALKYKKWLLFTQNFLFGQFMLRNTIVLFRITQQVRLFLVEEHNRLVCSSAPITFLSHTMCCILQTSAEFSCSHSVSYIYSFIIGFVLSVDVYNFMWECVAPSRPL